MSDHTYQCMEVWGGNQPADNGVVMPGVDAWVCSRPYDNNESGGDVHYVSSCATGRITRFLVADVAGHGSTVSSVAITLRTLLRKYVNYIDQGRLVRDLNNEFSGLSEAGIFATAVLATYFTPTRYLTLCNAGHPRPMHFDSTKREWRVLTSREPLSPGASNIPLGIAEGVAYDQLGVRLAPNDLVMLYTDALVEAMNADGELLGESGLLRLLNSSNTTDLNAIVRHILSGIEAFGGRPKDDVTILFLKPNGMSPRTTLLERAGAVGRFLKLLISRGKSTPIPWPELSLINIVGALLRPVNRLWGGSKNHSRSA